MTFLYCIRVRGEKKKKRCVDRIDELVEQADGTVWNMPMWLENVSEDLPGPFFQVLLLGRSNIIRKSVQGQHKASTRQS